jgi:adenylate cyclase
MPSVLSGFEYDIFISYRHNDNLDGWVTDFVQNLEKELRSTLKDALTIYFDRNPHDGLLETYNVDKSLEGKLKCLVFIPIVSQTYCDTKSFAWQHEFCAFNNFAKKDQLGRDVKLSNGNVASRILPVKIHDLDAEDKSLIENEIGGVLRPIEFIYKEAGVNRPLTVSDKKEDNNNKTFYRDQVNKTANAIKEVITSLRTRNSESETRNPELKTRNPNESYGLEKRASRNTPVKKRLAATGIMVLLALAAYFLFLKPSSGKEQLAVLDKSIAVLPFVDLSESKDQGWFSDGLTEEILNSLAHVKGLHVTSRTSSFSFKGKNLRIQLIADSLGVNYVVEGSVRKSNAGVRITAQLIRAKDGFHIWSNNYNRTTSDILVVQQDIATKIAESLDVSLDPQAVRKMQRAGTTNPEAFLAFLKGQEFFRKAHNNRNFILPNLKQANVNFDEAISFDPDFVNAYIFHADFYLHYLDSKKSSIGDTLTDAEAYRSMMNDFARAVAKSKESIEKDFYHLHAVMYSNDWSAMRPIVERLLASSDAPRLFTYQSFSLVRLIHCLGYRQKTSAIDSIILENDPNNVEAQRDIVSSMISSGHFEEAVQTLDRLGNTQDPEMNFDQVFSLYKLGKMDDADVMLSRMDSSTTRFYHTLLALVAAGKGDVEKAKRIIQEDKKFDYLLFAIDAVYGRQAANQEASRLDKKPLDIALMFSYFYAPESPPFDLSATPNLAKKLKQVGIVIKQKQ